MNLLLNEFSWLGRTAQDTLSITIDFDAVQAGKVEPHTERAIRHVLGLARPEDGVQAIEWSDWDETIRRHSAQISSADTTGKQHDLYLLFLSGFVHEMRHTHDLLGSCFGQDCLFLLLNCYQNVLYLLNDLKRWQIATGKAIPVPLPDDFEALSVDSAKIIEKYRDVLEAMRQTQRPLGLPSWLTPIDILEMSACNVQLGFINEIFGPEHVVRVAQYIASSPNSEKYLRVRNSVVDYLISRGFAEGSVHEALSYLAWASLMVLAPSQGSISDGLNPAIAFEGFVEKLGRKRKTLGIDESIKAVGEFCKDWGLRTPTEMGIYYQMNMDRRLGSVPDDAPEPLREIHTGLKAAFERLQSFIENAPQLYFNTNAYPWAMITGSFPSVMVRARSAGRLEDFMSPGEQALSFKNWHFVDTTGCILRVFSEGFGAVGDHQLEGMIFDMLRNREDHRYEFKDSFFQ